VHNLAHSLATGRDRHEIISGIYEIAVASAAEESAPATTFTTAWAGASDRALSGAQIYLTWRAASTTALPSPAAARESAARLRSLSQRAHTCGVAPRTHRGNAVTHSGEISAVGAGRISARNRARVPTRRANRVFTLASESCRVDAVA
jgi:hypothetical protein